MSAGHVNGIVDQPSSGNGAGPHEPSGSASFDASQAAERRPEVAVGAAFVGGFLLALLLRRVRS
jgi:hypothetical protein